ncbi:Bicupin, oxalate decarboxylase/oxidase [Glonium stellatum]|uniref:Bicupin, oxalate decarboxylase/oxidase n=1 Tax=Glonium stellatum TaxID=574774 RepID=A0A8E2F7N3_9PEZI|nr:Bicupin, oxalate decarboxylase/oxidase [Glonium stellatum]
MKSAIRTLGAFSTLLVPGLAVPLPQAPEPLPATAKPPGPPGASGVLRAGPSLIGYGQPFQAEQTSGSTVVPPYEFGLAPGQSEDPELGLYLDLSNVRNPQPIRGGAKSPTDPGPRNYDYDRLNSDLFAPPATDSGDIPNAKWPFGLSHNRHGLRSAGWARQQNTDQLPVAKAMAGVNMRLEPYAYLELHWHSQGEWSLMLNGSVRLASSNEAGEAFIDDLQAGDVWFFPSGIPHSIQALEAGCEFLLVFDSGSFSEDTTFLVSELFEGNPREVLAKNFRTSTASFSNLPHGQLYIFPGSPPGNITSQNSTGPAGIIPPERSYSYHWSLQEPYRVPGGTVKILDPLSFPIADNFAVALFSIDPGAMREMHWHTTSDEWNYFLAGQARVTVFDVPEASRTFDFQAGDVGYIPVPDAHYVECVSDVPCVYLEVLLADMYNDISVAQWLGLTPRQVVRDTLMLSEDVLDRLPKVKPFIFPGSTNHTRTNYTVDVV